MVGKTGNGVQICNWFIKPEVQGTQVRSLPPECFRWCLGTITGVGSPIIAPGSMQKCMSPSLWGCIAYIDEESRPFLDFLDDYFCKILVGMMASVVVVLIWQS